LYAAENARIATVVSAEGETNSQLLARLGAPKGSVVLFGGCTLEHFRIRVAQSHLRTDLLPSDWSLAGVVAADEAGFWSVPLGQGEVSVVPGSGGVRYCPLREYDDPLLFPNVAVLRFQEDMAALLDVIDEFIRKKAVRTLVDVPDLIVRWLAFVWGVGQVGNPLFDGHGLPSAVWLQAVAALVGFLFAGVPSPLFFFALTFIMAFVPAVGGGGTTVAVAGFVLLTGRPGAALFLALWGMVVVGLADNALKPLLMRSSVQLHGALIFFALLGGLAFFGAVGLIAGPVILVFFLAVVRMARRESHAATG